MVVMFGFISTNTAPHFPSQPFWTTLFACFLWISEGGGGFSWYLNTHGSLGWERVLATGLAQLLSSLSAGWTAFKVVLRARFFFKWSSYKPLGDFPLYGKCYPICQTGHCTRVGAQEQSWSVASPFPWDELFYHVLNWIVCLLKRSLQHAAYLIEQRQIQTVK